MDVYLSIYYIVDYCSFRLWISVWRLEIEIAAFGEHDRPLATSKETNKNSKQAAARNKEWIERIHVKLAYVPIEKTGRLSVSSVTSLAHVDSELMLH